MYILYYINKKYVSLSSSYGPAPRCPIVVIARSRTSTESTYLQSPRPFLYVYGVHVLLQSPRLHVTQRAQAAGHGRKWRNVEGHTAKLLRLRSHGRPPINGPEANSLNWSTLPSLKPCEEKLLLPHKWQTCASPPAAAPTSNHKPMPRLQRLQPPSRTPTSLSYKLT